MTRQTTHRRIVTLAGAAVALGAMLTGCALFAGAAPRPVSAHTHHSTPKPHATPSATRTPASPTPSPVAAPPPPPPTLTPVPQGTVVAEGNVASPKGSIHFHYRMVSNGDNTYSAVYTDFTSTVPVPVSVTLLELPPSVGDGLTYHGIGDHQLGGPTTSAAPASSAPLGYVGNASFLGTLVTYSSVASPDGVPLELGPDKILAVNTIHWSIPPRQTNVHPVDGGTRPHASGAVTATTASGAPAGYVVGSDDTFDIVAERFGITSQALLWLNANGQQFDGRLNLYQGTTLNLDPEAL
ncbi:LysM domain-containing protein [Leifsonia sp. 2TAF2]|uniref:LysM peptidoglycan-binding domain-containing protein n=1 Tax=Leifsonia sp. 2TAF2 TaxID=3233009 RepID=UPI003F9533CB